MLGSGIDSGNALWGRGNPGATFSGQWPPPTISVSHMCTDSGPSQNRAPISAASSAVVGLGLSNSPPELFSGRDTCHCTVPLRSAPFATAVTHLCAFSLSSPLLSPLLSSPLFASPLLSFPILSSTLLASPSLDTERHRSGTAISGFPRTTWTRPTCGGRMSGPAARSASCSPT